MNITLYTKKKKKKNQGSHVAKHRDTEATKIINTMKGRPSFFDMEGQRI
jgi:hypothetical protein